MVLIHGMTIYWRRNLFSCPTYGPDLKVLRKAAIYF